MTSIGTTAFAPKRRFLPLMPVCVLLPAALLATLPILVRGASCGDDLHFHLGSWIDAQRSWKMGIPYPHWAWAANFGAGEPRFVFYPPLIWMLGALLGCVLPWAAVPAAMTFLLLAGTAFATRALARQRLEEPAATMAGCTAIFFGYALYTAYARAAFAELSGGFWIPLLLLFTLREGKPDAESKAVWQRRAFDGSTLPLALCIAGAWLSNAPVGVMASYLVAAVALTAAVMQRSLALALRAGVAAALGMGLAAIYLLPAIYEQRWVDIAQAVTLPGNRIEESWLFERLGNPLIWWHDKELQHVSWVAVFKVLVAMVSALLAWRRGIFSSRSRGWWVPLALIAPVVLLLQLPLSLPVWNALPKLRFLQFPWRWLLVVEAPMAIFFACGIFSLGRRRRGVALTAFAVLCAGCTVIAGKTLYVACSATGSVPAYFARYATTGLPGSAEYAPVGSRATVAAGVPDACLITDPVSDPISDLAFSGPSSGACGSLNSSIQGDENRLVRGSQEHAEHFSYVAEMPHAGHLLLHLRSFPAWRFSLNGQPVSPSDSIYREDGLVVLPVPKGPVKLAVDWRATTDVYAARWISGTSGLLLVLLAALGFAEDAMRRKATANPKEAIHLSS